MKRSFAMGSGRVVYKTSRLKTEDGKLIITEEPVFRGKPEEHAKKLMRAHSPSGALGLIDKLGSSDPFWIMARNYVANRIKAAAEKKG